MKKDKTKMKNINPFKLITSLVILGSCLVFSPVAQAQPAFHGTLTFQVEGPITVTNGMSMGMMDAGRTVSTPLLNDSTTLAISTNAVVGSATGDFAALKIKHGSAITLGSGTVGPPMEMAMPGMGDMLMGSLEGFSFAANSGLYISSDLLLVTSPGPNRLHFYAPVTVTDSTDSTAPDYGMAYGELNGYFTADKKGVITGYFTIYVPEVTW